MAREASETLKEQVREYWNERTCGSQFNYEAEPYTLEYYEQVETYRYLVEPEIHSFAQFTRYHGKKVLEIGIGMGTDFLQWVRAGAEAYGVDLTTESIDHVRRRLQLYGLKAADLRTADAENLPYPASTFDVVYSWGVIHHSPNTRQALAEIVRVLKPGGSAKIMVYHRTSMRLFLMWVMLGLMKGRPWRTYADIMWNDQESPGTKAYTQREMRDMLAGFPVADIRMRSPVANWELLVNMDRARWKSVVMGLLSRLMGPQTAGFWLMVTFTKATTENRPE